MNKNIFRITTIMIVILTLILVAIFIDYFSKSEDIINRQNPNTHISGEKTSNREENNKNNATINSMEDGSKSGEETNAEHLAEQSGENLNNELKIDEEIITPENNKQETIKEPEENINDVKTEATDSGEANSISTVKIDFKDNTQDPVISSSTETSNQEKQQVLNELDDALQGLLEAVSKVPTVDETKLDASLESEVQP